MKDNRPVWDKLKEIPELPGIYQMIDSKGNIIYIGKSKCLKKRVHSYFVESPKWEKAKKMVPFIYDIHYILTDTHLEAMLLECEMIKRKKPYFNAMMKNDECYVYLTLSNQSKGKPLIVTYVRDQISFGPFRSRSRLQDFIDSLANLYPFTEKRKKLQFEYHFFPQKLTQEEWAENRKLLEKLFTVPKIMEEFLALLEKKMKKAAREEKFETALKYRDLIRSTRYVQKNLCEYSEWMSQQLVYVENTYKGKKYFFIYDGLVIHKVMMPNEDENSEEVFLKSFVKESKDILNTLLNQKQTKTILPPIKITCPQQGENGEKVRIDFQDIVYAELSKAIENENCRIYPIKDCI